MPSARRSSGRGRWLAAGLVGASLLAIPAAAAPKETTVVGGQLLAHVSQPVAARYWAANPAFAPAAVGERLEAVAERGNDQRGRGRGRRAAEEVFNNDVFGLPQNEESVSACATNPDVVIEGTNDYRGLLDPVGNFTGWHFSNNGGRELTNEGLLPPVPLLSDPSREVPSGGDPVKVAEKSCRYLFAASLANDPTDPFANPNGVAVYRSTPETLASCDTESDSANPACWPTRRLVAEGAGIPEPTPDAPSHFLDKEWMDVGRSGDADYVWVTYSDFAITGPGELDFTAEIFAVRCDIDLDECTDPIPISEDDVDVQFSDVTIAPDGRVYVTWAQIAGELEEEPQTFTIKLRVAEPGSTDFGPERVVYVEERAIPFGGFLHANDFRIATYPKNDVAILDGRPRIFVTWDACRFRPLPNICEEAVIKLTSSDDLGSSWSDPIVISEEGDSYFPSIVSDDDPQRPTLAFTWFTNRFDRLFHNAQDVEFATMDPEARRLAGLRRLTRPSNEPEADPVLGGIFIGDYIEVFATGRTAYVGYNANYRQAQLLAPLGAEGIPVAQQDNYLVRLNIPR
jgi:hypothetical protein